MAAYSGKFVLRLTAERHRQLAQMAHQKNASLNQICVDLISAGLKGESTLPLWQVELEKQLSKIQKKLGETLLGVAVFGSRANETATEVSDVDVLICMKSEITINRALYAWWDDHVSGSQFECNPVFAHPPDFLKTSSFWYEMAINHRILYDPQKTLQSIFAQLIETVYGGKVHRKWSQGQPYWVMEPL
jgi:hypothetical protein